MEFKFCGGCNPLYNRVLVYEKLKGKLLKVDYIILNGCHRGCKKIFGEKKYINVQEFFITHSFKDWEEEKIIEWVLKKNGSLSNRVDEE